MSNAPVHPINGKYPVEWKVKAQALATYFAGLIGMAILNGVADANLIAELPDSVEVFVAPLLPVAVGALAGWKARHQERAGESWPAIQREEPLPSPHPRNPFDA
jgi:hypothetical protein